MKTAIIELMVDNMKETLNFYTHVLNFEKKAVVPQSNPFFVTIQNGNVIIMLYCRDEFVKEIPRFKNTKLGGTFVLYINVNNIQELYDSIKEKATIIQELHQTDYGSIEFSIEDPNRYILMFNQEK